MWLRCLVAALVSLLGSTELVLSVGSVHAAAIYSFEGLANGSLTGQDAWTTYSTYSGFSVLDATDSGVNTSKVAFAASPAGATNFSVRANDANFAFPTHTASATGATLQFDIKASLATTASTYFGLASNVDGVPGINTTLERAPAFGIINGVFGIQHLGSSVGLTSLGTPAAAGVAEGDWLQMQMIIDFAANSGAGTATVWYRNLTDNQTEFSQLTTEPVGLNLTGRYTGDYAAMQDPASWNTLMVVRANSPAMQVDNLVGNLPVVMSPTYTFDRLSTGALTGQDGWTTYGSYHAFNVVAGTGNGASKVAYATTTPHNFSIRENDSNWSFTPHSGLVAAVQYDFQFKPGTDANATNSGIYFGLAADVDGTGTIGSTLERAPAFGILMSEFGIQHLGDTVGYDLLGRPDVDFGVDADDWLRLQMLVDRTESPDGLATLFFMNLTKGDTDWTQINDTPIDLGLTARYEGDYAVLRDPANWDTMMIVRAASIGMQVDNIVPNAVPAVPEPASLVLLLLGAVAVGMLGRRRARR